MTNQASRALQTAQPFTSQEVELMRRTVAKGASPDQFLLFLEMCKHYRLNPLMRQIYCIVDKSGRMIIQVSIDGFRLMAERTNRYAGQIGPFWCGTDGVWVDVWLAPQPPAAAKVAVVRKDFTEPIWGVARYSSYSRNTETWSKMSDIMIAKCAESLAFRRAFPAQMGGLYTVEEMGQTNEEQALPPVMVEEVEEGRALVEGSAHEVVIDVERQIIKLEKRAFSLGIAKDREEWESLVSTAGVVGDIKTPIDLARVQQFIATFEQEMQSV